MLTQKDKQQLQEKGMDASAVQEQLERFKKGYPQLNITEPATLERGIKQYNEEEKEKLRSLYQKKQKNTNICKFVPASGAASRMFKKIFEILSAYDGSEQKYLELLTDRSPNSVYFLCENIHEFAFYNDLQQICSEKGDCIESKFNKKDYVGALKLIVSEKGLNYGNYPKGLIKFHKYKNEERTALEEHLVEGAMYAKSNKEVNIHFTVSPEYYDSFARHIENIIPQYEERFDVTFNIDLSVQKPETDTIAVTMDNDPAINENGELIFRPGGHGALLANLDEIDADLIFIKNIDNIVTDRLKPKTVEYKELLGGVLLEMKDKINNYLEKLTGTDEVPDASVTKIANFANQKLNIDLPKDFKKLDKQQKVDFLTQKLNRPFRVCGMVKNEDEPGGGPFWVQSNEGEESLQIVESSQFDKDNPIQMKVFESATHFNPVDIACSTKDFKGNKFDLSQYADPDTGFISHKTMKGMPVKALEHPGLWNGAMANWTTLFVEVPMETFNPVKTINDLLRKEHRF